MAWQTSRITYCWEHWYSQWFGAQSGRSTRDIQNYPSDCQENRHFAEVSETHHRDNQLKCLKKRRAQELTASNRASLINHLISGEIILMRVSKTKANTLNICCDVFVHNCQFVMTFNACITVVVNMLCITR